MKTIVVSLLVYISTWLRTRRSMQMEILALRHQLGVYQRLVRRPIIKPEVRELVLNLNEYHAALLKVLGERYEEQYSENS